MEYSYNEETHSTNSKGIKKPSTLLSETCHLVVDMVISSPILTRIGTILRARTPL